MAGSSGGDSVKTLQWEKAGNNRWLEAPIRVCVPGPLESSGEDGIMGPGRWRVAPARPRRLAPQSRAGKLGSPSPANVAGHGRLLPQKGGREAFPVLTHLCPRAGKAGREERDFRAGENLDSSPGSAPST